MDDMSDFEWPEYQEVELEQPNTLTTSFEELDKIMGGGLPGGRIVELHGNEAQCKSTLMLHAIACVTQKEGTAALIDTEKSFDIEYAKKLGVVPENLLVSQPGFGEQGLEILHTLVLAGGVDLIVLDSIAGLIPLAELTMDIGDHHAGLHARMLSQALHRLSTDLAKTNTCVVLINQMRTSGARQFVDEDEKSSGGGVVKYYSFIRLELTRLGDDISVEGNDIKRSFRVRAHTAKNKMAPPFQTTEFDIKGVAYASHRMAGPNSR